MKMDSTYSIFCEQGEYQIMMLIFERKICVIAGTQTTDLQISVLAP